MNELNLSIVSEEVEKAFESDGLKGQLAARFTATLFSDMGEYAREDVSADRLAQLALNAFTFYRQRDAGQRKLRLYEFDDGGAAGPVTIIEATNDDMPFLLSSMLAELNSRGLTARFVSHPIFRVHRNDSGELTGLVASHSAPVNAGHAESFVHIHIDPLTTEAQRSELHERLNAIIEDVRISVADWMPMVSRLREVIDSFTTMPPPVAVDELAESIQFLKWLADGHFTFLGVRQYDFSMKGSEPVLKMDPESGLGLLRDPDRRVLRRTGSDEEMSPIAKEFFSTPDLLIITKANFLSPVQRRVHVDSIGIKLYSPEGNLSGELRLVGLFSASAYNDSSKRIPFLRHKVDQVFRNLRYGPTSYSGRVLTNILETFPRDELFQVGSDLLTEFADRLVRLELMPRTRVLFRRDEFGRFTSVLVYVMRERFTTKLRSEIIADRKSVV